MLSRSLYTHHFKYHRKPRRASAGRQATRCKRVWLGIHTHTRVLLKHLGSILVSSCDFSSPAPCTALASHPQVQAQLLPPSARIGNGTFLRHPRGHSSALVAAALLQSLLPACTHWLSTPFCWRGDGAGDSCWKSV